MERVEQRSRLKPVPRESSFERLNTIAWLWNRPVGEIRDIPGVNSTLLPNTQQTLGEYLTYGSFPTFTSFRDEYIHNRGNVAGEIAELQQLKEANTV